MNFKYFSKNGEVLPIEQAVVPITNLEYSYGYGVYETIRVEKKMALFLNDHIARLLKSAKIIDLKYDFTNEQIIQYVQDLVENLEEDTYNLKILLIGASSTAEVLLFIFPSAPYFPDRKLYKEGVSVITYPYERLYPNAKTLNMLPSYLAYSKAKNAYCYDALLINKNNCITEGTRTNFFVIKDKTLYTAPTKDVLEGVTKKILVEIAEENGYKIVEQEIKLTDISQFDGAFLTSTSTKVLPIKKIDDFEYPEISAEIINLEKLFDQFVQKAINV